ncbi:sensor histidine kinase [Paenibacillus hemerocallicola]|uniref:Sensor histidine kinase n=1 Tax=Paenibacillus hemerocallicola TaxID=1172614 RepID=A0A5C4T2S0_9BACL|nr:sensor histidine kinase [Paenibacillus hemerocallicola]TNJ63176.1 sensor histidine kinase [Paenibacillus hemerocallicola]
MKLITKMLLLIAMLMVPVIALYMYSNDQSIGVVEEQINIANQNRLKLFLEKIEGTMDQVSNYSNIITKDPDLYGMTGNALPADRYDYAVLVDSIERKLGLFSLSTDWMSRFSLYFPASGRAVSSHSSIVYDESYLTEHLSANWIFRPITVNGIPKRAFTRYFVEPYAGVTDLRQASIIVEVDLMEDNIVSLLDSFKSQGNNDPFLYKAPDGYVLNGTADGGIARRIIDSYDVAANVRAKNHDTIMLDNKRYLIYFFQSPKLGWTLIDYVPLADIVAPLTKSRYLFYVTVGLLLFLGGAAAYLLYVHVQVPVELLTESVSKLKKGQFSVRLPLNRNREFRRLIAQFNEMAAQIQHLVEKVYSEELRSKEAVMKQLQSQINPHFLYNSLAYIISMAKMNRPKPIEAMAYSLADYFKYTTRNVSMTTTIREEIDFVTSYMEIMNYQLNKICWRIAIPDSMQHMPIPRLLIQPVVENAIVHGLESKPDEGEIRIIGTDEADWCTITVEDDGAGLTAEELERLNGRIAQIETDGDSFGLWNVNQRLRHQFGGQSGIAIESSADGGLRVVLRWEKNEAAKEGDSHFFGSDRGRP